MKKRLIALLLVFVLVFASLAGCSKPASGGDESKGSQGGNAGGDAKNIGVLIFDYSNDYISYVRKGLEAAAKTGGVTFQTSDAANDQPKQTEQVDTVLSKGVDGLCIALVESTAAETMIEKVRDKNIPIAFVNKQPTPEVLNSYENCWFVGCATKMPGVQEMEMVLEDFKNDPTMDKNGDGKLQFVVIKGENGHENSEQRLLGMNEVIEASDIECVQLDLQVAGWNTQKAKDIMDAWISKYGDQIEAVVSQNDAMALGAIEALKAVGYFGEGGKSIAVYGINCIQTGLEAMEEGTLRGSVMTDMLSEGKVTFQVVQNAMKGVEDITQGIDAEYEKENKCFRVPTIPIRKENIDTAWAMYK